MFKTCLMVVMAVFLISGCRFSSDKENEELRAEIMMTISQERSLLFEDKGKTVITYFTVCLKPLECTTPTFVDPGSYASTRLLYNNKEVNKHLSDEPLDTLERFDIYIKRNGLFEETHSYLPSSALPSYYSNTRYLSLSDTKFELETNSRDYLFLRATHSLSDECTEMIDAGYFNRPKYQDDTVSVDINPQQLTIPEVPVGCQLLLTLEWTDKTEAVISPKYASGNLTFYFVETIKVSILN